jgi:hypothetical protein
MPSAEQLAAVAGAHNPQQHGSVGTETPEHNQVVSKVLVDALEGGHAHGPSVDTLINGLPGQGAAHDALQALAEHAGGAVPFGHTAFMTPFGAPHGMLSVEMVLQQHAPPAHG